MSFDETQRPSSGGTRVDTRRAQPPTSAGPPIMRTVVQNRYGPRPEDVLRLTKTDLPAVGRDEVLVRVHAASVDRGTWHVMSGLPYPIRLAGFGLRRPRYANPGRSLAGTIDTVGADVTGFHRGDEVFGIGTATFAEYATARPGRLAPKPPHLTMEQAAALPVSGLTALQAVRDHGEVSAGQHVLIVGASGGVGSLAVQIAKAFGATVTGVSSTAKLQAVRTLGADPVLDYTREDFADGRVRYDVILDVGGNTPLTRLRRALSPRGRLVIVGGETGGRWLGGFDRQLRAQLLSPFLPQQLGTFIAAENAADLAALGELCEAGTLSPAVGRTFPLDDVAAAVRYLLDGKAVGTLVIDLRPRAAQPPSPRRPE